MSKWLEDCLQRWGVDGQALQRREVRLGSLLFTVFVPGLEMGRKVVAGEEQMREEILSTEIEE